MRLIWKLLRSHLSVAQLTGFVVVNLVGVAIVLTSLQLYRDVAPIFSQPDSFMRNDYLILSKRVHALQALGVGNSNFTAGELRELRSQPFVREAGIFTPAGYNVTASISAGGMNLSTYLFFEAVPDEFLDVRSDQWRFAEGDRTVPIILPRNYLNLYNFGFAESQGLPRISQELLSAVTMEIEISGRGRSEVLRGRVVALSNRLNTILVPQSFIDWSNSVYADSPDGNPSRVIIEVRNSSDEALAAYIREKGYEIEGDNPDGGRTTYFLRLITAVVAGVGVLITGLSFFILMLSIFLLLQKNARRLEDLLLLGYTPGQVSRPYQLLTVGLNALVLVAAVVVMLVARSCYLPMLGELSPEYAPAGVWTTVAAGIVLVAAVTLLNCAAIRRKTGALWRHE